MTPSDFEVLQEEDIIDSRSLTRTAVVAGVIGGVSVVIAGVIVGCIAGLRPPEERLPPQQSVRVYPERTPILAAHGGADRSAEHRRELQRWGWVDRDAGVARIPIDRAIDLVVEEQPR